MRDVNRKNVTLLDSLKSLGKPWLKSIRAFGRNSDEPPEEVKMEKSKNEAIRMENPNPNVVEILDERGYGGLMFKCKICGQTWFPSILTGGSINRSAWQCPNGCKLEK